MSKLPLPKYDKWQVMRACFELALRAIEEVRALAMRPGPRGKDGFGFDDMAVVYDGERTITFRFMRGDDVKNFPFVMPIVLDRGVFKEGNAFTRGDGVTFGGSFWIAQRDTSDKPGTSDAWRLSVKHGRDGKDGRMLPPISNGPVKV